MGFAQRYRWTLTFLLMVGIVELALGIFAR